jgi:N-acetylmuramoyl-L-alanine amidase
MQMDALIILLQDILQRRFIPAAHILGHSDIAPARKQDPGELFDWQLLATHEIGLWPQLRQETVSVPAGLSALAQYGYDIADPDAAILAFQRHFRPRSLTGKMDEECRQILASLLTLAEQNTT